MMKEERQSEPIRLGLLLPETMQSIRERMELNKTETISPSPTSVGYRAGVLDAVGDFMHHKSPHRRFRCAGSGSL